MKRATLMVIGVLLVVAGVIWTLQGLDVFGGTSGMNGHKMWAVIGPIVAIVGIVLAVVGARSRSRTSVGPR